MQRTIYLCCLMFLGWIANAQNAATKNLLASLKDAKETTLEQVKKLVEEGADVNAICEEDKSWCYKMQPVHLAAAWSKLDILKCLVSKGANLKAKVEYPKDYWAGGTSHNRCNAFAIALYYFSGAKEGEEVLDYLLAKGFDINEYCYGGQTPVMYALMSEYTNEKTISYLIDRGADLNKLRDKATSSNWKESVYYYCSGVGANYPTKLKEAKLMFEHGAKTVGDMGDWSMLNYYIYYNESAMAKFLIENKLANPNDKSPYSDYITNLNFAVARRNLDMVHYLLMLGVDPNEKPEGGKSAFDYAKENNDTKMLELLQSKKLKPADQKWIELANSGEYTRVRFKNDKANVFSLPQINGQTISLEKYKGKVFLLNIWATWCGFCIQEMPTMQKLQDAINSPNFKILAVSVDNAETKVEVEQFINEHADFKFDYALDADYTKMSKEYSTSIPGTFIIDQYGDVVAEIQGAIKWDDPKYITLIKAILAR